MQEPNAQQSQKERKSNLLKDEKELVLRITLTQKEIARVQTELDKIYAAHRTIPRAPFAENTYNEPKKDNTITRALRNRIKEEEERTDQFRTSRTEQHRDIREDILNTSRVIDRRVTEPTKASSGHKVPQGQQEIKEPKGQKVLRTDEGVWAANILVTTRRDKLVRIEQEFEQTLKDVRKKLQVLDEEEVSELVVQG